MVFVLLSPAKTMAFENARPTIKGSVPHFDARANEIVGVLKKKSSAEIQKLMGISAKLGDLNVARFREFKTAAPELAICAYRGDTYVGLDAASLTDAQIRAAQNHIGILTGLYGVLRPMDFIKPYRLEMGTNIAVGVHKNLYAFWEDDIVERINQLAKKSSVILGCASNEYVDAVAVEKLNVPFIQCDFKEIKNDKAVTVGLFAKRARGRMARYVIENSIMDVASVKKFNADGYRFDKTLSDDKKFVFVRTGK